MSAETESMTRAEVLEIMTQVVAEYGEDFVYKKVDMVCLKVCLNWHDGCPSCLIGHVMHRWGMSADFLAQFRASGVGTLVKYYSKAHPVVVEEGVTKLLGAAQTVQDDGGSWGYALLVAREVNEEFSAVQAVSD